MPTTSGDEGRMGFPRRSPPHRDGPVVTFCGIWTQFCDKEESVAISRASDVFFVSHGGKQSTAMHVGRCVTATSHGVSIFAEQQANKPTTTNQQATTSHQATTSNNQQQRSTQKTTRRRRMACRRTCRRTEKHDGTTSKHSLHAALASLQSPSNALYFDALECACPF